MFFATPKIFDKNGHMGFFIMICERQKRLKKRACKFTNHWALHIKLMNRNSNATAMVELKAALVKGGIREAVVFLNSLTSHRFTSLYKFDNATLRNLTFFDRQHPEQNSCDDIPVEASYCVYVRDSSSKFLVEHAELDQRVINHPKRDSIQFYCGVPLTNEDGKMIGTICHFDVKPSRIADLDVDLMEYLARLMENCW